MVSVAAKPASRLSFGSWAAILAGWDLFVWGGRIRNILADGAGQTPLWSMIASVGFTAASVLVLVLWFTRWRRGMPVEGFGRTLVLVMAGAGVLLWAYRGLAIALADYSTAFIAVHTVLAVVSIGLGAVVLWTGSQGRLTS